MALHNEASPHIHNLISNIYILQLEPNQRCCHPPNPSFNLPCLSSNDLPLPKTASTISTLNKSARGSDNIPPPFQDNLWHFQTNMKFPLHKLFNYCKLSPFYLLAIYCLIATLMFLACFSLNYKTKGQNYASKSGIHLSLQQCYTYNRSWINTVEEMSIYFSLVRGSKAKWGKYSSWCPIDLDFNLPFANCLAGKLSWVSTRTCTNKNKNLHPTRLL